MKFGDFTKLAKSYAQWRPGYAPMVLKSFTQIIGGSGKNIADVGAGTGIWSRFLEGEGHNVLAVEPNDAMRGEGEKLSEGRNIVWSKGSAEDTGLPTASMDAVCMASSFHWTDFDKAIKEFSRILKPGGVFMALWNPRLIQSNPLLVEIEESLKKYAPEMKRVSTGNSEFCESLMDRLKARNEFEDVMYLEGRHTERQSPERYIGLWESVNDIQVQLGEEAFRQFLDGVKEKVTPLPWIDAEYKTRAWIARKPY